MLIKKKFEASSQWKSCFGNLISKTKQVQL